ncbi:hypothetical protein CWS20_24300 [Cytobacillus horneckiae]|uniref:Uncharacterized protein n=1 Tax=Cytobacillus horneckiae TaxID=549687 RepID=A0A2N0ZA87_9BACI|nr:hypothetical protein CWS20_24300 [Cytobacillus horneckiae]
MHAVVWNGSGPFAKSKRDGNHEFLQNENLLYYMIAEDKNNKQNKSLLSAKKKDIINSALFCSKIDVKIKIYRLLP